MEIKPNKPSYAPVLPISWVSFLWSFGSLMVFSILPTFLKEVLKASHGQIGLVEGLAISLSFGAKIFSGVFSDVQRKRKPMILLGSLLTIGTKFLFATSTTGVGFFGSRIIDRISKGIRSAPSDALVADLSMEHRNLFYGVRQGLYTLGAVFGATASILIMWLSDRNYYLVFWLATIPSVLAFWILLFHVKEGSVLQTKTASERWKWSEIKKLPSRYWYFMIIIFFLMLGRFSEAFLSLRAKEIGWEIYLLPLIIILMDLVHAAFAYSNGRLTEKLTRKHMLIGGLLFMMGANIVLSLASSWVGMSIGIILNGISLGLTQGILRAFIASLTPVHLYGTAFAFFYFISGIAIFIGNSLVGALADKFGLYAPFLWGLGVSTLATILLLVFSASSKKTAT